MSRLAGCAFNAISALFVLLSVAVALVVLGIAVDALEPPLLAPRQTQSVPTVAVLQSPTPRPSWTPSGAPSATAVAVHVPPSPRATDTPLPPTTVVPSATPTHTSSPTPVPPSATPSLTATPTFTPSPVGPSLTPAPTLSAYPFMVQPASLILRENYGNPGGCNWQGIAGQVTTARGEPVIGVQVRVRGEGIAELATLSGTNTFYGPSGWELMVAAAPNTGRYFVDLWLAGAQVSPTVEIVFSGTCQQNLATVNFIQTRPS